MKKEHTICFHTSKNVREYLEKIAEEECKSLSSIVGDIIYHYMKEKKALNGPKQERRAFTRKKVSLPASIHEVGSKTRELKRGTIRNISLGGLLISVPNKSKLETSADIQINEFHIFFTLPGSQRPIILTGRPQRVFGSEEQIQVGAAFLDSDFQDFQILHKYLI
jgi:hypothetical protein